VAREKRAAFRDETYWGRPVPGFGDPHAGVYVLGLARGLLCLGHQWLLVVASQIAPGVG
jgi:hypothetical protein